MKTIKEGAKTIKGCGVYYSLKETEEKERIRMFSLLLKNKAKVIFWKAQTPWHGKDKKPHRLAWKKNTLYLNTVAIRFKK